MKFNFFFFSFVFFFLNLSFLVVPCFSQGTWTQKASLGGGKRTAPVGFSIGANGYRATGADGVTKQDFWKFVPGSGTMGGVWTQMADLDGGPRHHASGFSIGDKGYIGTGTGPVGNRKDFWEYDTSINSWTQKADFGGAERWFAVGFSIGTKGYIGDGDGFDDFWEYTPGPGFMGGFWTKKANIPLAVSSGASAGFSIGTKGYIGTGGIGVKEFWEYDPLLDKWTQKTDFGGLARGAALGFSIGCKGYIGTGSGDAGYFKDFWEYDPYSLINGIDANGNPMGAWNQKADYGGAPIDFGLKFSIGSKGYIGGGYAGGVSSVAEDFWEYTPDGGGASPIVILSSNSSSICMGNSVCLTVGGTDSYSWSPGTALSATYGNIVTATPMVNTTYTIKDTADCSIPAIINLYVIAFPTLLVSSNITVCAGNSVPLSASGAMKYSWLPSESLNISIGSTVIATPTATTIYSVTGGIGECYSNDLVSVKVGSIPLSSISSNVSIVLGASTLLSASGAPVIWSPSTTLSCSNCTSTKANPRAITTYYAKIIGEYGCSVTDSVTVTVITICGEIFVPNAFSPNGDRENDVLYAHTQSISSMAEMYFAIYDRWGEKVFETDDFSKGWDGNFNDKAMNSTVFMYYFRAVCKNGTIQDRSGNFSLIK